MTDAPIAPRVVVFEDDNAAYAALSSTLGESVGAVGAVLVRFPGDEPWNSAHGSGDLTRLVGESLRHPRSASLVVLDWDLSKYRQPVTSGLVRELCEDLGIPVCIYRTFGGDLGRAKKLQRWQDREIAIDSSRPTDEIGTISGSCLRGFLAIETAFIGTHRLSEVIREVLRAPGSAEVQLDQYAWGNPDLLRAAEREEPQRFAATELGYWIYNRLLQFAGVLVGPVAAASYLGIDDGVFVSRPELQEPFHEARYTGPFAETGPYWWTSALDDIRARYSTMDDQTVVDGRTVLDRVGRPAPPARCIRNHEGAGFYCIITGRPVCGEHSVPPTGWLPIGADLSRIELGRYEDLSAWLAL